MLQLVQVAGCKLDIKSSSYPLQSIFLYSPPLNCNTDYGGGLDYFCTLTLSRFFKKSVKFDYSGDT